MIHKGENQSMGIYGIPFTFPTSEVKAYAQKSAPTMTFTRDSVNAIYYQYKSFVIDKQFNPYGENQNLEDGAGLVEAIAMKTGQKIGPVRIVLFSIREMVDKGQLEPHYWTMEKPSHDVSASVKTAVTSPSNQIVKISNNLKWIGIIGIAAVGVYFAYPFLKKLRSKKK